MEIQEISCSESQGFPHCFFQPAINVVNPTNPTPTEFKCPLCEKLLTAYPDDGVNLTKGVTLHCDGECIPTCHESPFGHSTNPKEAYIILCQKYRKS
jgi:hypothetical protein